MVTWLFTPWTGLVFGAPPPLVELGTITLDPPSIVAPRAFVIWNPPPIPQFDSRSLPEPVRPL